MKIELVEGNGRYGEYNIISDDNELLLGRFCCNIEKDAKGKTIYKKRKIYIVKQKHWYITLLVLGHELLHSLISSHASYSSSNSLICFTRLSV